MVDGVRGGWWFPSRRNIARRRSVAFADGKIKAGLSGEACSAVSRLVASSVRLRRLPIPGRGDRGGSPLVPAGATACPIARVRSRPARVGIGSRRGRRVSRASAERPLVQGVCEASVAGIAGQPDPATARSSGDRRGAGVVTAGFAIGVGLWVVAEFAEDPGAEHGPEAGQAQARLRSTTHRFGCTAKPRCSAGLRTISTVVCSVAWPSRLAGRRALDRRTRAGSGWPDRR
jgi:hypothetical protein